MQNQELTNWEKRFISWLELNGDHSDGSHDLGHFRRVWKAARYINEQEGAALECATQARATQEGATLEGATQAGEAADPLILLAAAYFHDLVSLPKNHPQRADSSRLSAERTVLLLESDFPDFPREKIEGVRHAIHAHSFSAGVRPLTAEARILQDADRMEAVGAIGLARVFYTAGQLGQRLFDDGDAMAEGRQPDDKKFALDHFQVKLLKLPALMNTAAGRQLAEVNASYLREFLKKIKKEIEGAY
jgi:uncharacterized protein